MTDNSVPGASAGAPQDNSPDENGIVPWCEITVTISTSSGDREVQGLVHPLVAGLAVTSQHLGLFDVTHLASGKLIAKGYQRMWGAVLVAAEYALCADWTRDATALAAEFPAHQLCVIPQGQPVLSNRPLLPFPYPAAGQPVLTQGTP